MWPGVGRESPMNKLEGLHWMLLNFLSGRVENEKIAQCHRRLLCLPLVLPGFPLIENSMKRTLIVKVLLFCER